MKLTVFEFLIRAIPESFILMFALFTLCNIKINKKRYIISSILLGIFEYSIRFLPINYGVNTIVAIFVMIIIMCKINKSDTVLAIKSSLVVTIGLFICEWVNVFMINVLFKDKLEEIMTNVVLKTIVGIPSLLFLLIITFLYHLKKGSYKCVKD